MFFEIKNLSFFSHYLLENNRNFSLSGKLNNKCPICISKKVETYFKVLLDNPETNKSKSILKLICKNCGHSFFNQKYERKMLINFTKIYGMKILGI